MSSYSEEKFNTALTVFRSSEYTSIRTSAYAFNISRSTLTSRYSTRTPRSKSHESQKMLSIAEEEAF